MKERKDLGLQVIKLLNKLTIMELIDNNIYTIHLKRRKSVLQGILISAGSKWILLKYIPVDYVLDGYILIRTEHLKKIARGDDEIFSETVIHLKWSVKKMDKSYPNLNMDFDILYYLMKNEIVIQFDFNDDSICYIGLIKKLNAKTIRIKGLKPNGNWEEESMYLLERIRTIQFDNDYINSLVSYNKWMLNQY